MAERSSAIEIRGKKDTYVYYNKDTIGKGGFANVFKGRRITDKEVVAIKKIVKRLDYGTKEVEHMERLSKDPKNIYTVKLLDYFHDKDKEELYLILPFYKFGSLRDHIRKNGKLETQTAGKILIQLVSCLDYLHNDKGIMHRDLTSANVIIKEIKDDGRIIVLLSDFGLAKQVGNAAYKNKQTCCGTPGYMPPEVKYGKYEIGVEVYSLGGILYNMLTGKEPDVGREKEQLKYVSDGLARELLDSLWNKEPKNRPTLQEMKRHQFINQYVSKVRRSSSRHTSATRDCKHRTLDENRKCIRCGEKVAKSTKSVKDSRDSAYGSTNKISNRNTDGNSNRGSNRNTDGNTNRGSNRNTDRGSNRNTGGTRQTSKDPSVRSRKTDNEDAQNDIVWPVPSFEYFAPTSKKQINEYRYISPKGRFVIVDANTFYFEALKNGYVKYIFEVILRDEKQEVNVYVPKNEKQILPQLEDDLIENKKSTGTIRNANRLEEYTSFYMSIVKAINVFYGRNAKINYAYVNGNRKYNAKLMYNDSFRFIFSPNKIFAQERGTSENDFHPAPKGSNAKLTDDETALFIKTRKFLLGLDRLNVEKDGTSFYKPYCMNNKLL